MNAAIDLNVENTVTASKEEILKDFSMSAKTSIHRAIASAPLRLLISKGWIRGSVLNYGYCD